MITSQLEQSFSIAEVFVQTFYMAIIIIMIRAYILVDKLACSGYNKDMQLRFMLGAEIGLLDMEYLANQQMV